MTNFYPKTCVFRSQIRFSFSFVHAPQSGGTPFIVLSACWKHVSPGCTRHQNLKDMLKGNRVTLAECKILCDADPLCKAVEFGSDHGSEKSSASKVTFFICFLYLIGPYNAGPYLKSALITLFSNCKE